MKHLSRDEMKKVMGGNPPPVGCVAKCCMNGGGGCEPGGYGIGTFSVPNCNEAAEVCTFGAGTLISCSCSIGGA